MRIHLGALGCRLNEAELERWANDFGAAGDALADTPADADVVVLNTCAVTREAVAKSRRRLQRLQRENPAAKLVVSGCYSELEPAGALASLGVDLVVPNADKESLVPLVRAAFDDPSMPAAATLPSGQSLFRRNRHRAFVKVQDGCRYRCAFCIVTVARGAERSRTLAELVAEVRTLVAGGVREIVLTGVHVGGYGSDLGTDLAALVRALLADTDVPRLRFASVEPWDLSDDFLALFADPRVQPHMHLPLQSGSDAVLRRMSRRCRSGDFSRLVRDLREAVPGFGVTTDVIAGFPGETEEEWRETLRFVESQRFSHVHAFTYSERDGTRAAEHARPGSGVPRRRERTRELVGSGGAASRGRPCSEAVGGVAEVLWEGGRRADGGDEAGREAGGTGGEAGRAGGCARDRPMAVGATPATPPTTCGSSPTGPTRLWPTGSARPGSNASRAAYLIGTPLLSS